MSFGSSDWQPWILNEEESLPLLKHAYDCGINTWDAVSNIHILQIQASQQSAPSSLGLHLHLTIQQKPYPQPRARTEEIGTPQLTTHQG